MPLLAVEPPPEAHDGLRAPVGLLDLEHDFKYEPVKALLAVNQQAEPGALFCDRQVTIELEGVGDVNRAVAAPPVSA